MATIAISDSLRTVCSSHKVTKKQPQPQLRSAARSSKEATNVNVVSLNVEAQNGTNIAKQETPALHLDKPEADDKTDSSVVKFAEERWKNGTWDLNMFSKDGKMDWDGIIVAGFKFEKSLPYLLFMIPFKLVLLSIGKIVYFVCIGTAEAKRRKCLELHPEASTNEEPVVFRSSIIPWWAWMMRSHLPEAELINGRAAMVGFFMAYVVDALTGLGVVGQAGNFICKAGFFVTVTAIILFRRTEDFENLKKLANEATFYDK